MKTKLEAIRSIAATRRVAITMALFAIIALAIIGCKQDASPTPTPVPQSKTLEGVKNSSDVAVTVTVNYTALPGVVPSYMSPLETAVKGVFASGSKTGNYTINVISGNSIAADGVLTIGEAWFANKDASAIYAGISGMIRRELGLSTSPASSGA